MRLDELDFIASVVAGRSPRNWLRSISVAFARTSTEVVVGLAAAAVVASWPIGVACDGKIGVFCGSEEARVEGLEQRFETGSRRQDEGELKLGLSENTPGIIVCRWVGINRRMELRESARYDGNDADASEKSATPLTVLEDRVGNDLQ